MHIGGKSIEVLPTQRLGLEDIYYQQNPGNIFSSRLLSNSSYSVWPTIWHPLGDARGNANVGMAVTDEAYSFLYDYLTVEEFAGSVPDSRQVERYDMPNLLAMNFYIKGVLGTGAASNHRIDKQAKSLGEYLRAKYIEVCRKYPLRESLNRLGFCQRGPYLLALVRCIKCASGIQLCGDHAST